jgi:hypothetical protein
VTAATASAPANPQGRLTDHRINLTLYKLGLIVEGDLTRHHRVAVFMEQLPSWKPPAALGG